ncbi:hypothetical protein [uncultured Azohydromonas sp.]|uniref:hypothetical protein n=1 Tax=uncultured Azohydromonas sp. TaxID=487342 RepID=UPI0026018BA4|nr:hypothetical protein [uncultured Azohydromonas sp.]
MKGIVAFVLFAQLMAAASVLAAVKLRQALGAPGVTPLQFLVMSLQMWLPTAIAFVFVMNVVLEKWELRPLLAIPVLLVSLLVPGVAIAALLVRRVQRRARPARPLTA